ncbi:MAG: amidohydrolase family protein [Anaerolineae bacterium]
MGSLGVDPNRIQVDLLLDNGLVLTMDSNRRIITSGAVAVSGRDIVAVGSREELLASYQAEEVINCDGHIIMPGLINSHTHMPMSLLRGLADDQRLDVWLHGYILPVEREFANPEFCFLGTLLSCAELIRGGVTCFADMYFYEEEVAWAAVQAGMRGICGATVMKAPTPDAVNYEAGLRNCANLLARWLGHDTIIAAPAPHSVYMCTLEILRETTRLALEAGVPQLIHLAETADEVSNWVRATNRGPARWLEENGVLESKVTAAHCVHISDEDMGILQRHDVGVAHCPTSNLKLASGIAPVAEMLERGLKVGLGTDGCASNNDLDMFEEMRLSALLPKAATGNPRAVPAVESVAMATIAGARALHLDHLIGSLEAGKRADIIIVRADRVYHLPHYETTGQNVYSRLVYATKSSDVRDVIIDGKLVMRDGFLDTLDEHKIIDQAVALAARVNHFIVARESSVLDKLIAVGGLELQETYEVQAKGIIAAEGAFLDALQRSQIPITQHTSRDQYDTYFIFADPNQGRLRYREDNLIHTDGSLAPIYSLTLTGPVVEARMAHSVVLTRSRFTATADRSLRFYREYFKPLQIREIVKHRERYHIRYQGVDFAVNIDKITQPAQTQVYLEIKSRTWSEQDAFHKAALIGDLLMILGAHPEDMQVDSYVDIFGQDQS